MHGDIPDKLTANTLQ